MDETLAEIIREDLGDESPVDKIMAEMLAPKNQSWLTLLKLFEHYI
jgi:hypothetical protein